MRPPEEIRLKRGTILEGSEISLENTGVANVLVQDVCGLPPAYDSNLFHNCCFLSHCQKREDFAEDIYCHTSKPHNIFGQVRSHKERGELGEGASIKV